MTEEVNTSVYKNNDPKEPAMFIECDCNGHALHVQRMEWDDAKLNDKWWLEITIWDRSPASIPFKFLERIRWAWWIIRTGRPWTDYCMLSEEKSLELQKFLQQHTRPPIIK